MHSAIETNPTPNPRTQNLGTPEPRNLGTWGALLTMVASAALLAQSPQQPVFRSGAENVPVFVTVSDKSGQLVPDLKKEDFQVFDNGKAQPLAVFDNSP